MEKVVDKQPVTVGVSNDNEVSEQSMFEETVSWDDLKKAREDAVGAVLQNQELVVELTKLKKAELEKNSVALDLVNGVLNTYQELADDIRNISLEHAVDKALIKTSKGKVEVPKTFKTGVITDNEEELSYIAIATNYITVIEKVGHISGTTYPDIMVKLGMETDGVEDAYKDGVKAAAGVTDEK